MKDLTLNLNAVDIEKIRTAMEEDGFLRKIVSAGLAYGDDLCQDLVTIPLGSPEATQIALTIQARILAIRWYSSIIENLLSKEIQDDNRDRN